MSVATASQPVTFAPAVIEPGRVYRLDDFQRVTGMGRHAYRSAVANGLRVVRTAGRVFVRGDDWLRYIDAVAEAQD